MYYCDSCSYCSKVFYVFSDSREHGAEALYAGIKKHLGEYNEDEKEHKFDDGASLDTNEIYNELTETAAPPPGGYELR